MKKQILFIILSLFIFVGFAGVRQARADILLRSLVSVDPQARQVAGISQTYLSYDLTDYYDPIADGYLYYTSPTQVIDGEYGEGYNSFYPPWFYGISVDFTTSNYQPNRIICTYTDHYARSTWGPVLTGEWHDPYRLSTLSPSNDGEEVAERYITTPSSFSDYYAQGDVYYLGYTNVCMRMPTVQSVALEGYTSPVTNNPTYLGGGRRIFADRLGPDDQTNMRILRVKATLALPYSGSQPYQNARVDFRNFDVDDPSSDPIIDPDGAAGNDNRYLRGTPEQAGTLSRCNAISPNSCFKPTDSTGATDVDFTVTTSPGDNFVISASTDQNYSPGINVNGTGLQDSSGNPITEDPTYITRAKRSPLLTVWRKVHLEVDSMGEVQDNLVSGYIRSKVTVGSTPVWINVYPTTGDMEEGRFRSSGTIPGGRLTLLGTSDELEVLDNTADQVRVRSASGAAVSLRINQLFGMYDDDDYDSDNLFYSGDNQEDIEATGDTFARLRPSPLVNENPFAAAYIEPNFTWAEGQPGMNDTDVTFRLNVPITSQFRTEYGVVNEFRDSDGSERDDFWVGYILIGYQWGTLVDNDPMEETGGGGVAPAVNQLTAFTNETTSHEIPPGGVGAILFLENMRDIDFEDPTARFRLKTAPHELGHQFGLLGDDSPLPPGLNDWGLMGYNPSLEFVPTHINVLRWRYSSPGRAF